MKTRNKNCVNLIYVAQQAFLLTGYFTLATTFSWRKQILKPISSQVTIFTIAEQLSQIEQES